MGRHMGSGLCEPLKLTVRYVQLGGQMLGPSALTLPNGSHGFYNTVCMLFFFIIHKLM